MEIPSTYETSGVFYIYDGSFEGLLTAVYTAVYSRIIPRGIGVLKTGQLSFDTEYIEVETNRNFARRVYDALYRKIGALGLRRLYYVFLSNGHDKDTIIYKYMMLGFKNGEKTNFALADSTVGDAFTLSEGVSRETERFRKNLRFSVMDWGVQYGEFESEHCLLPALMPFFINKNKTTPFILHDNTHKLCGVYDSRDWHVSMTDFLSPPGSALFKEDEDRMWRAFFQNVVPKRVPQIPIHRQNMPCQYFKSVWSLK